MMSPRHTPTKSTRLPAGAAIASLAAAAVMVFAAGDADARFAGHPGATGRANGGTCNRCHSPQLYEGLAILLPTEFRKDCYKELPGDAGWELVSSYYVVPYSSGDGAVGRNEVPIKLSLLEPPSYDAAPGAEDPPGLWCPVEGQVQPAQECTTPADCETGDLCNDYGATVQEVTQLPGMLPCTSGEAQNVIESQCGMVGALCANDICAQRMDRAINSCGATLPTCQEGGWAGFAMEVVGDAADPGTPLLAPAADEALARQADTGGVAASSLTEVNHSEPKLFENGKAEWNLVLRTPRYGGAAAQSVTLYASANACNHNLAADVGDITAVSQATIYFSIPSDANDPNSPPSGNTAPDLECAEAPVCASGQVLDADLQCKCPNGYKLSEGTPANPARCEAGCAAPTVSDHAVWVSAVALIGVGALVRRRRRGR